MIAYSEDADGTELVATAGTTGRAKVVAVVPAPSATRVLAERFGLRGASVCVFAGALRFAAPLRFAAAVQAAGGTSVVVAHDDACAVLAAVERHGATHLHLAPVTLARLLDLPADALRGAASLEAVLLTGAACPVPLKRRALEALGPIVHEYYACAEANLLTAIAPGEALARPGSVGRPLAGVPEILDDAGAPVPAGAVGAIWTSSGSFTYLGEPEETALAHDAYGRSTAGDVGYLDEDGYLYVVGRAADTIVSRGVEVHPQEAENVLVTHPSVLDAAVFGVPDPALGEVVHAVVVPRAAAGAGLEDELVRFCARHLAGYKCPRRIDVRTSLPRRGSGTLHTRLLREEYATRLVSR